MLWDAENAYDAIHTLAVHTAWVWDCAFSADSEYLVTGVAQFTLRVPVWDDAFQCRLTTPAACGMWLRERWWLISRAIRRPLRQWRSWTFESAVFCW